MLHGDKKPGDGISQTGDTTKNMFDALDFDLLDTAPFDSSVNDSNNMFNNIDWDQLQSLTNYNRLVEPIEDGSPFLEVANSVAKGLLNVVTGTALAIVRDVGNIGNFITTGHLDPNFLRVMFDMTKDVNDYIEEFFPGQKGFKGDFWLSQVPQGIGSTLGFILTLLGSGGTSAVYKGLSLGKKAVVFAKQAAPVAIVGALSESTNVFQETFRETRGTPDHIRNTMIMDIIGHITGTTEAIPILGGLKRIKSLNTAGKNLITKVIKNSLLSGGEEGAQEFIQQAVEGISANALYDANKDVMRDAREGGLVGFVAGMLMAGVGTVAQAKYTQHQDKQAKLILDEQKDFLNKVSDKAKFAIKNVGMLGDFATTLEFTNNPDKGLIGISEEARKAGKDNLNQNLGVNITSTWTDLSKVKNPNLIDALYVLGQKNYNSYLQGVNNVLKDKKIISPLIAAGVSYDDMHPINTEIYNKALIEVSKTDLIDKLGIGLNLNDVNLQDLKKDLLVGVAMNVGNNGWEMIRTKYKDYTKAKDINIEELINTAKLAQQDPNYKKEFSNAHDKIADTFINASSKLTDKITATINEDLVNTTPSIKEGKETEARITPIIDFDVDDNKHFMEPEFQALNEILASNIAKELGYTFGGVQSFAKGQKKLYLFTHPITGSTLSFFENELISTTVKARLEESVEAFKSAKTFKGESLFESELPISDKPLGDIIYGKQLSTFTGVTVGELFEYLEDNEIIAEELKGIADTLKEFVGDVPLNISEIEMDGKSYRGAFSPAGFDIFGGDVAGPRGAITINPNVNTSDIKNLSRTFIHEAIHAWTAPYMLSDSKNAKVFRGQMAGLLKYIKESIESPTDKSGYVRFDLTNAPAGYRNSIRSGALKEYADNYLKDPFEFVNAVMAGEPHMIPILDRIRFKESIGSKKMSALERFFSILWEHFSKLLGKKINKKSALAEFENIMHTYYADINAFHLSQRGIETPTEKKIRYQRAMEKTKYLDEELDDSYEKLSDELDPGQEDDINSENVIDMETVSGFTQFIASLKGIEKGDYIKQLKIMTPLIAMEDIAELDSQNDNIIEVRLKKLFKTQYSRNFNTSIAVDRKGREQENYADFKRSMISRKLSRAQEVEPKAHYNLIIVRRNNREHTYEMVRLPEKFKTAKGTMGNVFRESIRLEGFMPALENIFGLSKGSIEVAFINSFDTYEAYGNDKKGRPVTSRNIQKLSKWDLGIKSKEKGEISSHLSNIFYNTKDIVNDRRFIYLGNFGDKNTLPILTISSESYDKIAEKIPALLAIYEKALLANPAFAYEPSSTKGEVHTEVVKNVLEDLWYNVDFSQFAETGKFETIVANLDRNRVQKRQAKWIHNLTVIQEDPDTAADIIDRISVKTMSGISYDNEQKGFNIRVAILNSSSIDEEGNPIKIAIEIDGNLFNVNDLLENAMAGINTPTTDGASFYILGEFDRIYHEVYGTFKFGALKNVISSLSGQKALFIKHAMHGLHPSDPLAVWMRQSNIAMLSSDGAVKIGKSPITKDDQGKEQPGSGYGSYNLEELVNGDAKNDERTFTIPLKYFNRIKEEQNLSIKGGRPRQAINGSALIKENPALAAADPQNTLTDNIGSLIESIATNYTESYKDIDNASMMEHLRDIIHNPTSPKQVVLSNILRNVIGTGNVETLLNLYGNTLHHGMIAEHINKKLKRSLDDALQMVTPGWRAALGPSLGILSKISQVDPVLHPQNIKWHITSLGMDDKVFKAAVPNKLLRSLIKDKRMAQRKLSIALTKSSREVIEKSQGTLKNINDQLNITITGLVDVESAKSKETRDEDFIRRMKAGIQNSFNLINSDVSEVQSYTDKLGKDILESTSGRLKKGYTIITQDDAARHGVKPGDRILIIVTPTDSALSISVAIVAAVLPTRGTNRLSENNKVILNSEYIQTIVGKDFDIDTISMLPYDPDYWTTRTFDELLDIVSVSNEKYIEHMRSTMESVLKEAGKPFVDNDGKIVEHMDRASIFNDKFRIAYAEAMNGASEGRSIKNYSAIGKDFHIINDAYTHNPSAIINIRLYHTALSAINFVAKNVEMPVYNNIGVQIGTKKITFEVNHKNWFKTHTLHHIMTTHLLDFPNNTSILEYNGDLNDPKTKMKMFQHFWGLSKLDMDSLPSHYVSAVDELTKMLFEKAFFLAKDVDITTRKTASYFDALQGTLDQNYILSLLAKPTLEGGTELKNMYNKMVDTQFQNWVSNNNPYYLSDRFGQKQRIEDTTSYKEREAVTNEKKAFISTFINGLSTEDSKGQTKIYDYGLFRLLSKIDPSISPMYGLTQKIGLAVEVKVAADMVKARPNVWQIMKEFIFKQIKNEKFSFFKDKNAARSEIYRGYTIDTITGNPQTSNPDVATIALSLLPKEIDYLSVDKNGNRRTKLLSEKGGKKTYGNGPLESTQKTAIAIIFGFDEISNVTEKGKLANVISGDEIVNRAARANAFPHLFYDILDKNIIRFSGESKVIKLQIADKHILLSSDGAGRLVITTGEKSYYGKQILKADNEVTKSLKRHLTEVGYIWESYDNRLALGKLLKIPENLTIDERKEILKPWIVDNLYNNEQLNRLDQETFWISYMGQLTNKALKDDRAFGLQLNRSFMNENKPYTYGYNNTLLEMLSEFEPRMRDEYLYYFNKAVHNIIRPNIKEVTEAIRTRGIEDSKLLLEPDFPEVVSQLEFGDILYDSLEEMEVSKFKISDYRAFSKLSYRDAHKALKALLTEEAMLMALTDNGVEISSIIKDVHTLNSSQFKLKYNEMKLGPIQGAFVNYEKVAFAAIGGKIIHDTSSAKLRQLYWVLLNVKRNYLAKDKPLNFVHRTLLNTFLFDDYAPLHEIKTYAFVDRSEQIGFGLSPNDILPKLIFKSDLDVRMSIQPASIFRTHGESTLTLLKTERLRSGLAGRIVRMNDYIGDIGNILSSMQSRKKYHKFSSKDKELKSILREYDLTKKDDGELTSDQMNTIVHQGFITAENMRANMGFSVGESSVKGKFTYTSKGRLYDEGKGFTIYNVLEKEFPSYTAKQKLIFLQALQYRKLYDIEARNTVLSALKYLKASVSEVSTGVSRGEEVEYIRSLERRYQEYLEAIDKRYGNYMPHSYPMEMYKIGWKEQNFKMIYNSLLGERKFETIKKMKGKGSYNEEIVNKTDAQLQEQAEILLEEGWNKIEQGSPGPSFIPNFQMRLLKNVEYNTSDLGVHTKYVTNLMQGVKKDLTMVDYHLYLNKARAKGESRRVINSVKRWYANQITNRLLHSRNIKIDKLKGKRGREISFLITGERVDYLMGGSKSEMRVAGVLNEINFKEGYIKLYIDEASRKVELKRLRDRAEAFATVTENVTAIASSEQMILMNDLVRQTFMEPLTIEEQSKITVEGASKLITEALDKAFNDPSRTGIYQISEIYAKDLQGNVMRNEVEMYLKKGAVEFFKGRAREISNIKAMDGQFSSVMQESEYKIFKGIGTGFGALSKGFRKTLGALVLAGWNAPKALARNTVGFIISNFSHAPIRSMVNFIQAIRDYGHIMQSDYSALNAEEKMVRDALISAGLASPKNMVDITLGSLNVVIEKGDVGQGSTWNKLKYIANIFQSATGYREYVSELTDLETKKRKSMTIVKTNRVVKDIIVLKRQWRGKIEGLLKEGEDISNNELTRMLAKIDPSGKKINLAEREGITKGMAVKLFASTLFNGMYVAGLKIQSYAEMLRIPTFIMGYNRAAELGYEGQDRIQYALNAVEAWNANYGPANKQLGASTELGRSGYQFAQYKMNAISKQIRLFRDATVQNLGKENKWAGLFSENLRTAEELNRGIKEKGYVTKDDINLTRLLTLRWTFGLIGMQLGTTMLIKGTQYVQDPAIQAAYSIWDFIIALVTSTGPDDSEEVKQTIVNLAYDELYMLGVPALMGIGIAARGKDVSIWQALTQGRIGAHYDVSARIYNSLRSQERMSRKDKKHTFFNPQWLVDNFIFGLGLIGTSVRNSHKKSFYSPDYFFGGGEVGTYPAYARPMGPATEYNTLDKRIRKIIYEPWRSLIPSGDRIFPPTIR